MPADYTRNQHRRPNRRYPEPTRAPLAFHRNLPDYRRTPLHRLDRLANELGIGGLYVKDESHRLTLPAFKVLGASWAVYRWACERLGREPWGWNSVADLREMLRPLGWRTLVTATDGNHGRGVAKTAAWLGWNARVFMPKGTVRARIQAIESEGATVTVVRGSYDDAVTAAQQAAREPGTLLVQDTSWPGYEQIPGWIIDGYSTLLWEIEDELTEQAWQQPDLVLIPVGVGSLAAAVVKHYRRESVAHPPALVSVEPTAAACTLASLKAGKSVTVPARDSTLMAGLNCGTLASLAWPLLRDSLDASIAIPDRGLASTLSLLNAAGIESGESGASTTAGLLALLHDPALRELKHSLGVGSDTRVLVFNTEGVTDPDSPLLRG